MRSQSRPRWCPMVSVVACRLMVLGGPLVVAGQVQARSAAPDVRGTWDRGTWQVRRPASALMRQMIEHIFGPGYFRVGVGPFGRIWF